MKRANHYLVAATVLILLAGVVAGQLAFRNTHPDYAASGNAAFPDEVGGPPPGMPPAAGASGSAAGEGAGVSPGSVPEGMPLSVADLDQGPQPNDGKPFPEEITGLARTSYVTGAAALAEISKLHGTEIKAQSAEIATYGGGEEQITIWMTNSADKGEAQALFQAMLDRMIKNPTVYSTPEALSIKNRAYLATRGNGMNNYLYLRGTRIYWAAFKLPMDKIMGAMSYIVNN
jgi:hypothetical protein